MWQAETHIVNLDIDNYGKSVRQLGYMIVVSNGWITQRWLVYEGDYQNRSKPMKVKDEDLKKVGLK